MGQKFANVVRLYIDDTGRRLSTIGELIASQGKGANIARHAHSILSSSQYFGVMRLAGLAETLETMASAAKNADRLDKPSAAASSFTAMQKAFAAARPMLEKHFEKPAS